MLLIFSNSCLVGLMEHLLDGLVEGEVVLLLSCFICSLRCDYFVLVVVVSLFLFLLRVAHLTADEEKPIHRCLLTFVFLLIYLLVSKFG